MCLQLAHLSIGLLHGGLQVLYLRYSVFKLQLLIGDLGALIISLSFREPQVGFVRAYLVVPGVLLILF